MASLKVLDAAAAAAAPSAVTDGKSLVRGRNAGSSTGEGFDISALENVALLVFADAGTPTFMARVWVYSPLTSKWHVLGIAQNGLDADRGKLNGGVTIDLTRPFEQLLGELRHFARFALEIVTLSGNTVTAYLVDRG